MSEFERDGVLWLRGAFDPAAIAEAVWEELTRVQGIRRDDRSTWGKWTPLSRLQELAKSESSAAVLTPHVQDELERLLGTGWGVGQWGLLVTFPRFGAQWTVPGHGWHLDMPARDSDVLDVVRAFAYLNDVRPGGGGTCVVAGSHRVASALVRRSGESAISSRDVRKSLRRQHRWFYELMKPEESPARVARFVDEGADVDGVPVRVVELSGEPGDVALWHPGLLHAASPNCADEPRFMLSCTASRNGFAPGGEGLSDRMASG
jgi:ectoine hydroxylase-related dioxygenase (phytanoyl-CoA dioxygenase family)